MKIEEKWYVSLLKWIGLLFLSFIIIILFFILVLSIPQTEHQYEYIDLDNNKGTAKECSYKFREYRAGGQGSPVCELADGTIKQVKEYRCIYEKSSVPIKEMWKEISE